LLNKFLAFILITQSFIIGQSSWTIQPSVFFTRGEYSSQVNSNIFSTYLSLAYRSKFFFTLGYEFIKVEDPFWNYHQSNLLGNLIYWRPDLRLKLSVLKVNGDYSDQSNTKPILEKGLLFSPELLLGSYPFYYGLGYVNFNQTKSIKTSSHQIYFRNDYYPHYKFLISSILSGIYFTDKQKYLALEVITYYTPIYYLTLKTSFTIGSRKNYFNPDLLIFFNHYQTQFSNYSLQVYYNFYKKITGIFTYQRSNFTDFSINYFSLGLKTNIN